MSAPVAFARSVYGALLRVPVLGALARRTVAVLKGLARLSSTDPLGIEDRVQFLTSAVAGLRARADDQQAALDAAQLQLQMTTAALEGLRSDMDAASSRSPAAPKDGEIRLDWLDDAQARRVLSSLKGRPSGVVARAADVEAAVAAGDLQGLLAALGAGGSRPVVLRSRAELGALVASAGLRSPSWRTGDAPYELVAELAPVRSAAASARP